MKRLAAALEAARATRSRIAKEEALGGAFAAIAREEPDERALAVAARIAVGRALPSFDGRKLGVGWRLVYDVAAEHALAAGVDVGAATQRTGDLGDAIALMLEKVPGATERAGLSLVQVGELFEGIAATQSRDEKRARIAAALLHATPSEAQYLTKAILGELRIGAQAGVVVDAIARGFGRDVEEVRRAAALVTDLGELAVLAARDWLGDARLQILHPVAFMLATPIETIASPLAPSDFVVEDKIDGVRAQAHKLGAEVRLFARGLDDVTATFPEVAASLAEGHGDFVLDGELVALGPQGRPRPFMQLQNRLGRKEPSREILRATPVSFVAYDLLADGTGDLLALPWSARRERLEALGARGLGPAFAVNPVGPHPGELDARFDEARARGFEGLVLKRKDAAYEAGRRGQSWIKVKRAFATLDVVITAAELGHGKRASVLSDYTFAVWSGPGPDAELLNVGKAYSGLTDREIEAMTARLIALTVSTERRGGLRIVRPEIVLEVAFDGIQRSKRHASGFALRFPRIARIRDDKRPDDADRLAAVEALFTSQLSTGHREETPPAPPRTGRARASADDRQLDLFGTSPPRKR
jgi:DNA ligase 1